MLNFPSLRRRRDGVGDNDRGRRRHWHDDLFPDSQRDAIGVVSLIVMLPHLSRFGNGAFGSRRDECCVFRKDP